MFFKLLGAHSDQFRASLGETLAAGQCWVAWAKSFIMRSLQFSMLLKIFFLQHNQPTQRHGMDSPGKWASGPRFGSGDRPVGLCGLWSHWKNSRASASLSSGCSDSFSQFTSSADLHGPKDR